MVYTDKALDVTIIEIKQNIDKINDFLELDDEILNKLNLKEQDIINHFKEIYIKKSIYLLSYLKGENILVSYGLLLRLDNYIICHNCNTEGGSSGGPILSTKNNKLIAYHFGASKNQKYNVGNIIIISIIEFNKKYKYFFEIENDIEKNLLLNNIYSSKDSNISNNNIKELIPYRKELENIVSQKILLLSPSSSYKNHPRTVFFLNEPTLNENKIEKNLKITEVILKDKKNMILYKGYPNEPISLSGPMKYNRLIKTSIFDNSNLIWKIINKDNEMSSFLNKLNKYQRYNHFPNGIKLGYKYNLFNYFHKMKKNFQMTIIICQKIINFVNLKNYFLKI